MTDTAKRAEAALREAHALCIMERGNICEQTCEMPDGPATGTCDAQHAAIDRAVAWARLEQAEKMFSMFDRASPEPISFFQQRDERDRLRALVEERGQ